MGLQQIKGNTHVGIEWQGVVRDEPTFSERFISLLTVVVPINRFVAIPPRTGRPTRELPHATRQPALAAAASALPPRRDRDRFPRPGLRQHSAIRQVEASRVCVTPGLPLRTFAWHPPTGYPDRSECGCMSSLERNTRSVLFGVVGSAASSSDARWAAGIERSRWHRRNGRTSPSRSSCCSRRFRAPWTSRSGRVVTSL